jgi:Ca-activated chloride channel family protein
VAGGGQAYQTLDPASITRIFTQDTMIHTGRLIREEAFQPKMVERHPILKNLTTFESPPLLGYVKTNRKATAQVPLVTDIGDPLLAFWRYDLGKVTAFTSDCKSRWAAAWVAGWPGYSQLWAQLLRETARAPQGQNMDLTLRKQGEETVCEVQLLEDAGTFKNDASVEADIYFVPSNALGSTLKLLSTETLEQAGPGLYRATFRPADAGVYLVRARSGPQMVSAGDIFNPSAEAATGRTNHPLLERTARISGGTYWPSPDKGVQLSVEGSEVARYLELRPWLLGAFLVLFLADVALRRWAHIQGIRDQTRQFFRKVASQP